MDNLDSNELYHHGILGMKWGVRRYQNPDGTLTKAGKERYLYMGRARNAAKTKSDMDTLYNSLSNKDKELLGDDNHSKEWLTLQEGEYVVKRIIKRDGSIPVAAVDIMTTTKQGHLIVAIMTDPKYRGKGYATEAAKDGLDWYNRNKKRMKINKLGWGAYQSNTSSKAIAEKLGFEYDRKASNKEWAVYAKHSDDLDEEDFLEHWGILGMKWGVRRYQNADGSLTSAGRKRYASGKNVGFFEARRLKKKRAEAAKKRQATLEAKRKAEEDVQKHEAEKQEAIRSGNATQIAKFQNELSNQELRDVLARLDSKQKLSDLVAKETPKKETKLDKAMKIAEKGAKYADIAEKGIKVYNTFAKVSNAFADDNNQLPIIGEKREKKAPKNEAKEAAIRSGDAKEIAKWKGKLTPEETKTAMLTLDYWDKIKEKSVSSTVKEQKEGQKAAAKELAEKLSTHSDEYNEAVKRARDLDLHIKEQNKAERKQRVDDAKTALKELVNPSDRTKTIREYSNAEIGSKEVIDRILKDLEKNRR